VRHDIIEAPSRFVLDYAAAKLDPNVATSVVKGIAAGCVEAGSPCGGEPPKCPASMRAATMTCRLHDQRHERNLYHACPCQRRPGPSGVIQ
jgi:hypothetical protein